MWLKVPQCGTEYTPFNKDDWVLVDGNMSWDDNNNYFILTNNTIEQLWNKKKIDISKDFVSPLNFILEIETLMELMESLLF